MGILGLTRALAHADGKQGYRVKVLIPGAIKTPRTQPLLKAAVRYPNMEPFAASYQLKHGLALGRWGQPDGGVGVALFLAPDVASHVHGVTISVDGGFLASWPQRG